MSDNRNINAEEENIPDCVIKAFWDVRETGLVNMFDGSGVLRVMLNLNLYEAANWLIDIDRGRCNTKRFAMLLHQINESTKTMDRLIK